MTKPLLLIAAGGTGGHMFPAQSLAEEMLSRGWRVKLSTDARGARYTGAFPDAVKVEQVPSATFARGGPLAKLSVPFRLVAGVLRALGQLRRDRPSVVVGFGGYPSIPALGAAIILRLPRMVHEQNGVLGRVNQLFARRVALIGCGVWPTELPRGVRAVHVGNPVRAAVLAEAGAPYQPPSAGALHLLVIGGSQGARILSEIVPQALAGLDPALRRRLRVSHQARDEDHARAVAQYETAGIAAEVAPFFKDIPERMRRAQLVVSRSGASTIADLSVIGRPSILVPLAAAIRDEQTANARALVEAGGAVLMTEPQFTAAQLGGEVARILGDPAGAAEMARAALASGKPDAAEALATHVTELANRSPR